MRYPKRTILLATDAWLPQVNGVVRTYQRMQEELATRDVKLQVLSPQDFRTFPLPTYPEIRLACCRSRDIGRAVTQCGADAIHIPTEGPIGWAARRWCLRNNMPYTTCFHTRFPEYISARIPFVRPAMSYAILRRFHNGSSGTLVATPSLQRELKQRGFNTTRAWTRGVDTQAYQPSSARIFGDDTVLIYVGRVAVEKNIEAFLNIETDGHKVVVGEGPALKSLRYAYPTVTFTGKLEHQDLAEAYASSDVFVFPSRTDTFGIVMLEAMASGVPVAAYPVTGPVDVVEEGINGALDDDLGLAVERALTLDRTTIRRSAEAYSWSTCASQFLNTIAVVNAWDRQDVTNPPC